MAHVDDLTRRHTNMINNAFPFDVRISRQAFQVWFLQKIMSNKFNYWNGGDIIVPFAKNREVSIRTGGLVPKDDIVQLKGFTGKITSQVAHTGAVQLYESDLPDRSNRIVNTFLSGNGISQAFNQVTTRILETLSLQMGSRGPWLASAKQGTTWQAGASTGWIKVDRVTPFRHMQKLVCMSLPGTTGPIAPTVRWVGNIKTMEREILLCENKDDADRVDANNYPNPAGKNDSTLLTAAKRIVFYPDVSDTSTAAKVRERQPTSIREIMFPSTTNSGKDTIYGINKDRHQSLVSLLASGAQTELPNGSTRTRHLLRQLFVMDSMLKDRGVPHISQVVMSLPKYAVIKDILEVESQKWRQYGAEINARAFGWKKTRVSSVDDDNYLEIIGVQEWDNDTINFMDWPTWSFHTNGGVRQSRTPDGVRWYPDVDTSGVTFNAFLMCFSQLVCSFPATNAALHSLNSGTIDLKLTA